jgi:hypothetical protein
MMILFDTASIRRTNYICIYIHDDFAGEWSGERVAEWQGRYYTHKLQIVESAIFSPGSANGAAE